MAEKNETTEESAPKKGGNALLFALVGVVVGALVGGGLGFVLLAEPVERLTALYSDAFHLRSLGAWQSLVLVGGGALLGLVGSWLSVGRHLAAIEPS